jgi:RNA polymerase sigma-70 factor (ECF subfamily)
MGKEEESKDAVMEIFEKLIVDLKKHEIKNFKSWLYTVAKNHCLIKLRKENINDGKANEYKKLISGNMELEQFLNLDSRKERDLELLQESINALTQNQKKCIELFYLESKSYEEIVKITGFDTMAVKSYIQNGKRNMKNYLTERMEK